jgi:ABC-type lipoprotein release transport system permease subunit
MLSLVCTLAARNVSRHRAGTLAIVAVLSVGAFLLVTGKALLRDISSALASSVIQSVAGDLQVYDADARDKLALFGGDTLGEEDIGQIDDFARLRKSLEALPEVAAAVPMGMQLVGARRPNPADAAIEILRVKLRESLPAPSILESDSVKRLRWLADALHSELELHRPVAADAGELAQRIGVVSRLRTDDFWLELVRDPDSALFFLETEFAPLADDSRSYMFRVLGTDPQRYAEHFPRFEVVQGEQIPPGQHGLLLSDYFYERYLKHPVARGLDQIQRARARGLSIALDAESSAIARRLPLQSRSILRELAPQDAAALHVALRAFFEQQGGASAAGAELASLLERFLTVGEADFERRYAFFYANVARRIELYAFRIGSEVTLQSTTAGGYPRNTKLRLYGTYRYKGLEDSELAAATNIIDLPSLRYLAGLTGSDRVAESAPSEATAAMAAPSRDDAEAVLFGGGSPADGEAGSALSTEVEEAPVFARQAARSSGFEPAQLDTGAALNAAVILAPQADRAAAQARVRAVAAAHALQVVDWRAASGWLGQLMTILRSLVLGAAFFVLLVGVIVILSSLILSKLRRTTEFATVRAIGAKRSFLFGTMLMEGLVLGAAGTLVGLVLGAVFLNWVADVGVPAVHPLFNILFGGPRLYPALQAEDLVISALATLCVSTASACYPAMLALRVSPAIAMNAQD